MTAIAIALGLCAVGLLFRHRDGGVVSVLVLLGAIGFGATALGPVETGFVEKAATPIEVEIGEGRPVEDLLEAAARAGPRVDDLDVVLVRPDAALPGGPLGAVAVLADAPLPFDPKSVRLRALRTPRRGRPVSFELTAPGLDPPLEAAIEVTAGGERVSWSRISLGRKPASFSFRPDRAGEHRVTIEVAISDVGPRVAMAGRIEVGPAPRVLVLGPDGALADALRAQGLSVDAKVSGPFSNHAAVVVATPVPRKTQAALAEAIGDGLGAFVLAPAFGLPGHPLHDLLPLLPLPVREVGEEPGARSDSGKEEPRPPEPPTGDVGEPPPVRPDPVEVDKRTMAMVLLVDRSGSMGRRLPNGRTPMSYAKTSALQTAEALIEGDRVGLVTFGNKGAGRVELPLTDAGRRDRIRRGVERLAHGMEGTYLLSGLRAAERLLRGDDAAVKHVVVISDGEFQLEETPALRALAHEMATREHITVSILAILSGPSLSSFSRHAADIAAEGRGQFFAVRAADEIPVFVSVEVARSLDKIGRKPSGAGGGEGEGAEPPPPEPPKPDPDPVEPPEPEPPARVAVHAVAESPLPAPRPSGGWPDLGAAVPAVAPLDSLVLLVAGDEGWPLLAFANRGLGRVGAFAADLGGEDGRSFRADPAFPARLALWIQHVMRSEPAGRADVPLEAAIEPRVPTPPEAAALAELTGSAPVSAAEPAEPAARRFVRDLVPDQARGVLLVLLLLGLAEFLAVRRRARSETLPRG